jgi:hypothetical protein
MPQITNGVLTRLHGEENTPIGPPLPFNGGVFGQPDLPLPRQGMFSAKYPLPWGDMIDTIGSNRDTTLLGDAYERGSGLPVVGLIPKRMIGGPGCAPGMGNGAVDNLLSPTAGVSPMPLVLGALVGYYIAPDGKKVLGALAGAAGGSMGHRVGWTLGAIIGMLLAPILITKAKL